MLVVSTPSLSLRIRCEREIYSGSYETAPYPYKRQDNHDKEYAIPTGIRNQGTRIDDTRRLIAPGKLEISPIVNAPDPVIANGKMFLGDAQ